MSKEFICTIDQSRFTSEEALITHMVKSHSMTQEQGEYSADIHNALQTAFPTAHIEITTSQLDRQSAPRVDLNFFEFGADFSFYISKDTNENVYHGDFVYPDVIEAIGVYKNLLSEKDKLVQAVKEKFGSSTVEIHQIHQSSGVGDDTDSILLSFVVEGQECTASYEFQGFNEFLRLLEGRFVNSVSGECYADYGHYNSENTIYVDGIDLRDIAKRAKKLKVEILEIR